MNNKTPYSLPGHGSILITRKENGTATHLGPSCAQSRLSN